MRKELNKEEIRELGVKLEQEFGFKIDSKLRYFEKDEKEGVKIFIYSGDKIPKIPVEWTGLHFGTITPEGFAPSIDGAILMRNSARKVVEVDRKEIKELMKGNEIEYSGGDSGVVIVISVDLTCTGKASEGKITSLTPPSRRI